MKVVVKNFQIIKSASASFVPGLNVIVGPSNNGKSSLLKAIKALLYTESGTTPIRAGQTSYTIGIEYNGHTVVYQKGLKESLYKVDNDTYSKFGVSTPEEVSNALGIKELVLNGNKEQINFWDQMKYPFLLDKSSTELFRFIIDSGDDNKLSNVLKSMVTDRKKISQDIDITQGRLLEIDSQIESMKLKLKDSDAITKVCNGILALQSRVSKLNQMKDIKVKLIELNSKKLEISSSKDKIDTVCKVYTKYVQPIISSFTRREILVDRRSRIEECSKKIAINKVNLDKIAELVKTGTLLEKSRLVELLDRKIKLSEVNLKIANLKNSIKNAPKCNISNNKLLNINFIKSKIDSIKYDIDRLKLQEEKVKASILDIDNITKHITICPLCKQKIVKGGI